MKIYTLTGDDGTTSLSGGKRVSKTDLRIEAYGTVDELISWMGLIRGDEVNKTRKEILVYIQDQLMRSAARLARDNSNTEGRNVLPDGDCPTILEKEIDLMESYLEPLNSFILPGGNSSVSHCHIARCVCRRAERAVLRLNEKEEIPEVIRKFLNRLSDYLFVLARKVSSELDNEEIKWIVQIH
jgi:cob(I)alamin adenosyltransferase